MPKKSGGVWYPKVQELHAIRTAAQREAGESGVVVELVVWHENGSEKDPTPNRYLAASTGVDGPGVVEADAAPWDAFRRGVPLREGAARVEFLARTRRVPRSYVPGKVLGRLRVHYNCERIVSIYGVGSHVSYTPFMQPEATQNG